MRKDGSSVSPYLMTYDATSVMAKTLGSANAGDASVVPGTNVGRSTTGASSPLVSDCHAPCGVQPFELATRYAPKARVVLPTKVSSACNNTTYWRDGAL